MMKVVRRPDGALSARWGGSELFRYVYRPADPDLESPRPYFHPVRTLGGDLVSLYRPHDHVWHKGIAWSLCEVGGLNFWGGPSYRRGLGYLQLDNNGSVRHDRFARAGGGEDYARIDERLAWITPDGESWIRERREIGVTVLAALSAWRLSFATTMHNISGRTIRLGSPTTQGRENAGYSGLFWRGPRSFSGGTVLSTEGTGGDEMMGRRLPWLAYVGSHDETGRQSTLLFADNPANFCFPCQWFVRTSIFACVCPAPFFSAEYELERGESLQLRFDVLVADGALDPAACGALTSGMAAGLPAGVGPQASS